MVWNEVFLGLFARCTELYRSGNKDFETYYSPEDLGFLAEIGCRPREFFDFIEDFSDEGVPAPSTALLVAAVRRDFFLTVQNGKNTGGPLLSPENIPSFGDEIEGIPYLPRLLAKARAKLRGSLDPEIMFCCGGDRNFFAKQGGIHPADFLRHVWAAGDDDRKIIAAFGLRALG